MKYFMYHPFIFSVIAPCLAANTFSIYVRVTKRMQASLNFYVIGIMMGAKELN